VKLVLYFSFILQLFTFGEVRGQIVSPPDPYIKMLIKPSSVCDYDGTGLYFVVDYYASSPATLQWYLNDAPVGVSDFTHRFSSLNVGDAVYCKMTYGDGSASNTLKTETIIMGLKENELPAVFIESMDTLICGRTPASFIAYNRSEALSPRYEWIINGIETAEHTPKFSTDKLKDGDMVKCRMSVLTCSAGSDTLTTESNVITIRTLSRFDPAITITTATETICAANRTTFTASAVDIDANAVYTWRVNGNAVGTNSNSYVTDALKNGDEVSCTVYVDTASVCKLQAADTIKMNVLQEKPASIAVRASADTICEGSPVTFTATTTNEGREASYQWMINGVKTGESFKTFATTGLKRGDSVWCVLTTKNPCVPNNQLPSNIIAMQVKPSPMVSILSNDTSVMIGSVVQLEAMTTGNPIMFGWKPGALLTSPQSLTTFSKPLTTGTYSFTFEATGGNGCVNAQQVNVKVLQTFYMPASFTPNGDGMNDLFRIPPGSAFQLKEFLIFDRWGNKVFATADITKGWDGKYKNEMLPQTYIYVITGKDHSMKDVVIKGTVTLIR
jgi:gliding motility-associated-like protein